MVRSRYVILEVAQKLRLSTKGNASGSPVYLDLEIPGFLENLPWATQLDLFTLVEQASTNFRCGMFLRSGYTRTFESAAVAIGATMPAVGGSDESLRHAPYVTVANFNLSSRLQLAVWNAAGTANETAVFSASVGLLLIGQ